MLALLSGFAALSLLSGALLSLLPEGSLRRTASMAVGLMMLVYWAGGLQQLLQDLSCTFPLPDSPLTATGLTLPEETVTPPAEVTP